MSPPAFTPEQRDQVRERLLEMARADARVTAGALVGSSAGGGDRWSDLDITFGLAEGTAPPEILAEWTLALEREFGAVHLFDLPFRASLYRVFLFPGALQVDVSFTPGAEFRPLGPNWKLLFGEAKEPAEIPPTPANHQFGLAVHHAVRARICIERGNWLEAEFWISGVRDQALALACLRRALPSAHARGADQLPDDLRAAFAGALVKEMEKAELLRALSAAVELLIAEAGESQALASKTGAALRALRS